MTFLNLAKYAGAAALITAIGATAALAQGSYVSATACKAASAWDASAAKCVSCESLVTDRSALKSCKACKAGTAFNVAAKKCVKVTVKRPSNSIK